MIHPAMVHLAMIHPAMIHQSSSSSSSCTCSHFTGTAYTGHLHLQCLAPNHLITLILYQVPGALRSWHVDDMGYGMLSMFNPCMQI